MRSSFGLEFLHLNGGPKSLIACETVNIAPMLAGRFNVDNGRYGHPIRLVGIMKMHGRVVNFTAHAVKPKIAQAGIHGRNQFSDGAALLLDPNRTRKWDWIVLTAKLKRRRGRSTGNGFEIYFSKGHTVDSFLACGLERIAGLIRRVNNQEHAAKAVGNEQGARRITEGGFARIPGLDELQ